MKMVFCLKKRLLVMIRVHVGACKKAYHFSLPGVMNVLKVTDNMIVLMYGIACIYSRSHPSFCCINIHVHMTALVTILPPPLLHL